MIYAANILRDVGAPLVGISINLMASGVFRSRVAATSCGPRRASRGSTRSGKCISSPVGAISGQTVARYRPGAQTLLALPTFPRLARRGLNDDARFAGFRALSTLRLRLMPLRRYTGFRSGRSPQGLMHAARICMPPYAGCRLSTRKGIQAAQ